MPSDPAHPEPKRDGKIGDCDGCDVEDTHLALTREGYLCPDCLNGARLEEALELQYRGGKDSDGE